MAIVNLNTIKNWFKTGLKPTESQFFSTWDSFWHKQDEIPVENITGINEILIDKLDVDIFNNYLTNETIKIKYFDLYDLYESRIQIYTYNGTSFQFTLAANEIGVFYSRTQNNEQDMYDGWEVYLFKKGKGTWGGGTGATAITEDDFVLIHKSQYATDLPLGFRAEDVVIDYLTMNYTLWEHTPIAEYIKALHKSKANILDTLGLKFSWGFTDDNASIQRIKASSWIKGSYYLLSVTFDNYDALKTIQDPEIYYTLLIDRYRAKEHKGGRSVHRKAKYRHEVPANPSKGRINEIEIDNSTMILDFKQDLYFKADSAVNGFPQSSGSSASRNITGSGRSGWCDLGFRIRMSRKNNNGDDFVVHETAHLGFIRMLGIKANSGNRITYTLI